MTKREYQKALNENNTQKKGNELKYGKTKKRDNRLVEVSGKRIKVMKEPSITKAPKDYKKVLQEAQRIEKMLFIMFMRLMIAKMNMMTTMMLNMLVIIMVTIMILIIVKVLKSNIDHVNIEREVLNRKTSRKKT